MERILDLRRELDALLAALPVDLRDEVEARLAALGDGEAAVTVRSAPASTAAAPPALAEPEAARCAELAAFDSDGDGAISGFDRYWRLFRLWRDDGDGEIEPPEVFGLYDAGVREFSSAVRSYETADGTRGDVELVGGWITFDLAGKRRGAAILLVDADRLSRGGELALVDAAGSPLGGLRRLGETSMLAAAGSLVSLSCP